MSLSLVPSCPECETHHWPRYLCPEDPRCRECGQEHEFLVPCEDYADLLAEHQEFDEWSEAQQDRIDLYLNEF